MKHGRLIWLGFWLSLSAASPAQAQVELSAPLAQELARLSATSEVQRQSLADEVGGVLRLGVGEQYLSRLTGLAATRNYATGDVILIVQKLAELQRNELPTAVVHNKILEGIAKRAPTPAILHAVSTWFTVLGEAQTTVRDMEQKGLEYANPSERATLITLGATLAHHGAKQALPALAQAALELGRIKRSAASMIAAAELSETLLLSHAKPDQALALSSASLRANFSPQRIKALQRGVLDQLRQGMAVTDIMIDAQQKQFGSPKIPTQPPFGTPGGMPGSGMPGSGMPGGGMPGGGMPGGSFPMR